jgi:hypothetical protein
VQVAFTNDGRTPANADRNVRVNGIVVNGVKYESESSETFTTGTGEALTGITPGYKRSEYLTKNGYFQYYAPAPIGGTTIEILAAGAARQESLQLQIDGTAVRTWTGVKGTYNGAVYETFRFTTPSVVALNQIRFAFTNDGLTSTGLDKNLRVDAVLLNGVRYETEANDTFSTGGPLAAPTGFRRSEYLYNNGYFAYGQPFNPGTLSIAASQYTVVEGTPTVGVTFVRAGAAMERSRWTTPRSTPRRLRGKITRRKRERSLFCKGKPPRRSPSTSPMTPWVKERKLSMFPPTA